MDNNKNKRKRREEDEEEGLAVALKMPVLAKKRKRVSRRKKTFVCFVMIPKDSSEETSIFVKELESLSWSEHLLLEILEEADRWYDDFKTNPSAAGRGRRMASQVFSWFREFQYALKLKRRDIYTNGTHVYKSMFPDDGEVQAGFDANEVDEWQTLGNSLEFIEFSRQNHTITYIHKDWFDREEETK